jgi:serine/threonine protein kinase
MGKTCPACNVSYEDGSIFCPADGTTLRSLDENRDDLVGTVIADRYLLTEKIGEGGMGRVYLAHHVRVPRRAAIKVLRSGLANDYQIIAAFNREANNAAKMGNHPHVAEVYDFGETAEGLIYLAMEYIDGEPLSRLLERDGIVPPRRAAEIIRQVCEALTVAHELPNPVIHRDLKPDNIMLARNRDGSDCVKVVDFGIAKAITGETQKLTSPGFAVGTPKYMSPEQLSAGALDARSDIYSLGLIAFQMLTGKMPFPSASPEEESTLQWAVGRLVQPASPLAGTRTNVAWPAKLQGVFDRVLATSAADRYASAESFARDLTQAVDDLDRLPAEGAAAAPPVVAEHRRRPSLGVLITGGVAVVVVLVVAALGASGKLWTRDATEVAADGVPPAASAVDPSLRTDTAAGDLAARGGSVPNVTTPPAIVGGGATAADAPRPRAAAPTTASAESPGNARIARDSAPVVARRTDGTDVVTASRAALDSVDKMLAGPSNPTPEEATRMLETLRRIRPNLRREDDLRAQVYAAELLLVFGETSEACKLLRAVERDGIGTEAARIAQKYLNPSTELRQLNCPE